MELPPPPVTKCHAGRDVRNKALKIILAVFFVAALIPLNSYAEWLYGEGKMGEGLAIKHTPTLDEPWTTLQVCIRTSKGYYWKSAPAIKYTRDYTLCEPE